MGIYTTFFATAAASLTTAFPGWMAPELVERRGINPFTREPIVSRGINPFTREPIVTRTLGLPKGAAPGAANIPKKWTQFERKFLLPTELRPLLGGAAKGWPGDGAELFGHDDEATPEERALRNPVLAASDEATVYELPAVLVGALAALDDAKIPKLARAWSKVLVAEKTPYALEPLDAVEVLQELRRVAQAVKKGGGVYAYVF